MTEKLSGENADEIVLSRLNIAEVGTFYDVEGEHTKIRRDEQRVHGEGPRFAHHDWEASRHFPIKGRVLEDASQFPGRDWLSRSPCNDVYHRPSLAPLRS